MNDRRSNEEDLFAEALALPPAERARFLDDACRGDPDLRQRMEKLLRAHDAAGAFMQLSPAGETPSPLPIGSPRADARSGDRIGRYKLLEKIGEGGCGVVYMAEQEEPVRRRVALKVIKLGMDTKEVVARFEAERQALALMDHPNIARVFDGGATESGRPYFVMELVPGIPITKFCDEQNLPTRARLELFTQVCHAVQHAHQKGIIHRDLKPSNILVTLHDGTASEVKCVVPNALSAAFKPAAWGQAAPPSCRPFPKVIDFGIAKATQGRLTDATLFTAFEQFIGTPAYMSPEQAELSGLDIDTRSDIYSLGVLLYELLTGRPPFDPKTLVAAGLDEIRRIIREIEPPRPSTRLSTLSDLDRATIAKQRGTLPAQLSTQLRGDLDWIVMRCLEKDRTRRYDTPSALAADIARHLGNEPVIARPPSTTYRLGKMMRRNKLIASAGGLVVAALACGLTVSTWRYWKEREALRAAVEQRMRADAQAKRADEKAAELERQKNVAEELRQTADRHAATAVERSAQLARNLYASQMNEAFQAWDRADMTRVTALLRQHQPKPGEEDMRGFEWYYLWRLRHSDLRTISTARAGHRSVAFSPDGRRIAAAGDDGGVRVWDRPSGKLQFTGRHPSQEFIAAAPVGGVIVEAEVGVNAVLFSPDGKQVASAGADGTVKLWDTATGSLTATLGGHNNHVLAIAFAPGGVRLAAVTGIRPPRTIFARKFINESVTPTEIKIWDMQTRTLERTVTLPSSRGYLSVAFSPDGTRLLTGGARGQVTLWNTSTWTPTTRLQLGVPVCAVGFSPDGRRVACGGGEPTREQGVICTWRVDDEGGRPELHYFPPPFGLVFALEFAPDGRTLATAGRDQIVRIWNVATARELRTFRGHDAIIQGLAHDPTGRTLGSASADGTLKFWNPHRAQDVQELIGEASYGLTFVPDSRSLIASGKQLVALDVTSGKPARVAPDYHSVNLITAVSPDGKWIASGGADQVITLWSSGSWEKHRVLSDNMEKIEHLVFSPAGRLLASGSHDASRLWDMIGYHLLQTNPRRSGYLIFSQDGEILYGARGPGRAVALRTGESLPHTRFKARSPDGQWGAGSTPNGDRLMLIELATQQEKWRIRPHLEPFAAAFSTDNRTLATGSKDATVKLWNVASGQGLFIYKASSGIWSHALAFSNDGRWLAAGSGDGPDSSVLLFCAATPDEVKAGRSLGPPPRILGASTNRRPAPSKSKSGSRGPN